MKQIQVANYLLSKRKSSGRLNYRIEPISHDDPRTTSISVNSQELSLDTLSNLGFSNDNGVWKISITNKRSYFKEVQFDTQLSAIRFIHMATNAPIDFPGIKYMHELQQVYNLVTDRDLPQR